MKLSWNIFRSISDKTMKSWSISLRKAWAIIKLKSKMRGESVKFSFLKKDGTTRNAIGTLSEAKIPSANQSKGIRASVYSVTTFYDLNKDAWRCFKNENICLEK